MLAINVISQDASTIVSSEIRRLAVLVLGLSRKRMTMNRIS